LKVSGKMFACIAVHRSAEPDSLVVRLDFRDRDELIAADPATYYLTPHYVDYPSVLVRLNRVDRDTLRGLLTSAWRFTSTTRARQMPQRRSGRRQKARGRSH